jgi:Mrp family chromosome partitioning ATPase
LLHAPSLPSASPARPPPSLMCADTRFDADLQDDTPIVWRGPMATKAMDKMLMGTAWGRLDVLVVDMPPGWCGGGAGPLLYFG